MKAVRIHQFGGTEVLTYESEEPEASRAKRRVLCDAIIARLARFLIELHRSR